MTPEQCKQLDPVWAAYRDGKTVQWSDYHGDWYDYEHGKPTLCPVSFPLSIGGLKWRIKPEPPKPREWWVAWCKEHGTDMHVYTTIPKKECPHCHVVHVREVVEGGR